MSGPQLAGLTLADAPERWAELGFEIRDGIVALGGVALRLAGAAGGLTGWTLRGVAGDITDIDGLATAATEEPPAAEVVHANGAGALDHLVVLTPDFDRTSTALAAAGMPLRRVRHVQAGDFRQGFRRLGPAILEIVEARHAPPGPARFWGLVVIVADLAALAAQLGERLGQIKPAVQPGRRIATLRSGAGLSVPLAFMDPER